MEPTDTPTNLANQVKVGHALDQSHRIKSCGPERAHQNNEQSRRSSIQIADFQDNFDRNNWFHLLFKCGIKTKTHLEWLLWHWSSLGHLNFEPTWLNGLVGCKVAADLVKICVKDATHMGFYHMIQYLILEY